MTTRAVFPALLALATLASACKHDAADTAPSGSSSAQTGTAPTSSAAGGTATTAAATASATAAPAVDTGVKVAKKAPVVGSKMTEDFKANSALKITAAGKTFDVNEDETRSTDEEVLEVTGNAVTKMRVTITTDQKSTVEGGKPAKVKKGDDAGKTYVLVFKNGKAAVLNDKEKPANGADAKAVARQFSSFGKVDPMTEAMPDRALKPGEKVPELVEALKKSLKGTDDKETLEDVSVTFKGKEGDNAVFTVAVTMKNDGPFKMTVPMTGTFAMRIADGAPVSLVLDGPMNLIMTDKDKAQGVSGTGKIKLSSTTTYK